MRTTLKKIWHDPVWSKVIAGAILALAAVIWALWRESSFSFNYVDALRGARSAMVDLWCWLVSSVGVPRAIAWLVLLALIATVLLSIVREFRWRRQLRQAEASRQAADALVDALRTAAATAEKHAAAHSLAIPTRPGAPALMDVSAPRIAPLAELEEQLLKALVRIHPRRIDLRSLPPILDRTYPACEQTAEDLQSRDFVRIVHPAPYGGTSETSVGLTAKGRKVCLDHGWA